MLRIEKSKNGAELTVVLTGRIDTVTSPELDRLVDSGLDGVTALIFDFAEVDYISSAGLRVLLRAQQRMNKCGTMKLKNVKPIINEIFEITGFCEILSID